MSAPDPPAELEPLRGLLPRLGPALEARLRAAVSAGRLDRPAAAALARVLERAADPGELLASLDELGLRRALALLGLGRAPVEALMAEPEDLRVLAEELPPLDAVEEAESLDALRIMRRRATLALAAQELTGELPATQAAALLSALADALLGRALALVRPRVARRFPEAAALPLAVLALGKLGGRELNYSSDVDLVLVRGDGAPAEAAEALARAFVGAVQESAASGRLFRVDLRLRPYGSTGALAPRVAAAVAYYHQTGRAWERQALLKARPAAGDRAVGEELLRLLAPFLWREQLDAQAIDDMLRLRERMSARVEDAERDVKVGPGGIRDVEYAAQFLQLQHGGRDPTLRTPSTVEAIARLRRGYLRPAEADALLESYEALRRLEHLLQLTVDREVTRLPRGEAAAPLARALGLDIAGLEATYARARARARGVLDTLVRAPFLTESGASSAGQLEVRDLLLGEATADVAEPVLARFGFADPAAAWRHLQGMVRENSPLLSPSGRARTTLAGLLPRLLEAIAARPDPDRALRNLERALAPLGAKATVFELMAENPDVLHLLVSLAAGSDVLVEVLAAHPGVLDEVVDRLLTRTPVAIEEIEAEVAAALEAPRPAALAALRELRALYLLLVGVPDLAGRANVQNTARALADLAEGFLRAFVGHVAATVTRERGGWPPGGALFVLAVGKLGGRELAYASDLDLVLVYDGQEPTPDGTSPAELWGEVARRVIALGESPASVEGPLLPIDLRLRPGGSKAPLAARRDAALAYYGGDALGETARDFERLALQKARLVAGPPEEGAALMRELSALLYERRYGPELWDELTAMRRRQVEAAEPGSLKRGAGSVADVELLASALALTHGGARPRLREPNTAHLLDALEAEGLLEPAEHRDLRTAYGFLRRLGLRIRVRSWTTRPTLPEGQELRDLALGLGYTDVGAAPAEEHLRRELAFHRERVSAVFAAVVTRERAR